MYSLLNEKRIKNDIAITGEINLQGEVTAIGGLDIKIQGGIRAGVNTFLYPKSNHKDYKDFIEIYGEKDMVKGIEFKEVSNIKEVFDYVYE